MSGQILRSNEMIDGGFEICQMHRIMQMAMHVHVPERHRDFKTMIHSAIPGRLTRDRPAQAVNRRIVCLSRPLVQIAMAAPQ
jgi:hypothetical protein